MNSPFIRFFVESAFGSQPICMTLYPKWDNAADKFDVVVDFPIPPFPYIAIFFIYSTFHFIFMIIIIILCY